MNADLQTALIETGFIKDPRLITPNQFRANLVAQGKTIKEWAEERGYKPSQVTHVLHGRSKCNYGKGHEIAIAIGMKLTPID